MLDRYQKEKYVEEYKKAYTYDEENDRYGVLGMRYDPRIIDFFKRHNLYDEKMFEYLQDNTWGVCYADPPKARRVGCPVIRYKGRILGFVIIIPDVTNDFTMFIQVHEIAHGIYAYKHLGKKVEDRKLELLPFAIEKLYANEVQSEAVNNFSQRLDSMVDETSREPYRFALANRDEIVKKGISSFKEVDRTINVLSRKWCKQNR